MRKLKTVMLILLMSFMCLNSFSQKLMDDREIVGSDSEFKKIVNNYNLYNIRSTNHKWIATGIAIIGGTFAYNHMTSGSIIYIQKDYSMGIMIGTGALMTGFSISSIVYKVKSHRLWKNKLQL